MTIVTSGTNPTQLAREYMSLATESLRQFFGSSTLVDDEQHKAAVAAGIIAVAAAILGLIDSIDNLEINR